jgi:hypothetical protein
MDAAIAEAVMLTTVLPKRMMDRSLSGLERSRRTLLPDSVLRSLLF